MLDSLGIAADQDRIGHDAVAAGKPHAALLADCDDRADQMLVQSHAAGDAVHDHTEPLRRHVTCSFAFLSSGWSSGDSVDQSGCAPVANPGAVSDPVRRSPAWTARRTLFPSRA